MFDARPYSIHGLIAQAFSCYVFDNETPEARRRYLISDVKINCDIWDASDVSIAPIQAMAWVAITIYAIGLLALTALLLFIARKAILNNKPTALSTALRFLYKECALLCQGSHGVAGNCRPPLTCDWMPPFCLWQTSRGHSGGS